RDREQTRISRRRLEALSAARRIFRRDGSLQPGLRASDGASQRARSGGGQIGESHSESEGGGSGHEGNRRKQHRRPGSHPGSISTPAPQTANLPTNAMTATPAA